MLLHPLAGFTPGSGNDCLIARVEPALALVLSRLATQAGGTAAPGSP